MKPWEIFDQLLPTIHRYLQRRFLHIYPSFLQWDTDNPVHLKNTLLTNLPINAKTNGNSSEVYLCQTHLDEAHMKQSTVRQQCLLPSNRPTRWLDTNTLLNIKNNLKLKWQTLLILLDKLISSMPHKTRYNQIFFFNPPKRLFEWASSKVPVSVVVTPFYISAITH